MNLLALCDVIANTSSPTGLPVREMENEEPNCLPPELRAVQHTRHGILDVKSVKFLRYKHHEVLTINH